MQIQRTWWFSCFLLWPLLAWSQTIPGHNNFLIDLSMTSPPFLSEQQVEEDLHVYESILKEGYAAYDTLEAQGNRWNLHFQELKKALHSNKSKILVQHFQKKLIEGLMFTGDPSLKAEFKLYTRHYQDNVSSHKIPWITSMHVAVNNKGRYRVLPESRSREVSNTWMIGCSPLTYHYFPIFPERPGEPRFILGLFTNQRFENLHCVFANNLFSSYDLTLPLLSFEEPPREEENSPVFEWVDGPIPYVRWIREGAPTEESTLQFLKLPLLLQKRHALILDLRGNTTGSFAFIEKWFKKLTRDVWKNVIVKEKLSFVTLQGQLNQLQWMQRNTTQISLSDKQAIQKHQQQINSMITHMRHNQISTKWVETKFVFVGNSTAPAWDKKLIVIANRHCGDGCQFVVALAKQLPRAIHLGENTGFFPKNTVMPMYQLPHSKILLTLNHTLHLNHENTYVPPWGHEPTYWLFPPISLQTIYRFAGSSNFP